MRRTSLQPDRSNSRKASVLIVVLVVIGLLSLGAYTFSEFMLIEATSSNFHLSSAQSRAAADSGVELVASYLADRTQRTSSLSYNAPTLFQNQSLGTDSDGNDDLLARFSVVSPNSNDPSGGSIRFGLVDESAKINLNALATMDLEEVRRQQFLLDIPLMTPEIADAILDWIDADSLARPSGAEQDSYSGQSPSVTFRNGPISSLDELLLVRGVTPDLLFGEDLNRNGLLDPNENDGPAQPPIDNADGQLQRGWIEYFTIHSRESNVRADGSKKININNPDLDALFTAVQQELGLDTAKFIIAYRTVQQSSGTPGSPRVPGSGRRLNTGSGNNSNQPPELVGGIDISGGSNVNVSSLYELIGKEMQVKVDGSNTTLKSPWQKEPSEMIRYLPTLHDTFSLDDAEYRPGRININQAPQEILMNIPGLDPQVVQSIVAARDTVDASDESPERVTAGWLVVRQLVTLEKMIELDPYLTAQGDVYCFQVVGYSERGGPMNRLEAILDASGLNPVLLKFQDLSRLGSGYSREQLGVPPPP